MTYANTQKMLCVELQLDLGRRRRRVRGQHGVRACHPELLVGGVEHLRQAVGEDQQHVACTEPGVAWAR